MVVMTTLIIWVCRNIPARNILVPFLTKSMKLMALSLIVQVMALLRIIVKFIKALMMVPSLLVVWQMRVILQLQVAVMIFLIGLKVGMVKVLILRSIKRINLYRVMIVIVRRSVIIMVVIMLLSLPFILHRRILLLLVMVVVSKVLARALVWKRKQIMLRHVVKVSFRLRKLFPLKMFRRMVFLSRLILFLFLSRVVKKVLIFTLILLLR